MNTKIKFLLIGAVALAFALPSFADYPIRNVDKTKVRLTSGFWYDRLETNRLSTLKTCFAKCNETPRIANFTNAANRTTGTFGGIPFDDSDVFKVMEGAAYIVAANPADVATRNYVDWFIGQAAKAQEPDGYLYTARTLGFEHGSNVWFRTMMGPVRWSNVPFSHELYNVGHMYEAAVAWKEATEKDNFLDVAIRSADLIDRTFGNGRTQIKEASGHEEIELALVKLFRATGEKRYLDLAKTFIDFRGMGKAASEDWMLQDASHGDIAEINAPGAYFQNHIPFIRQRKAVGHAVRAAYLYCGAADVAALTGNKDYLVAIDAIWENAVSCKLHLNGGIGAEPRGEAFGPDYYLPNTNTYLETCAAIGNVLWNDRMFRRLGETKYVDVLERSAYNCCMAGISLSGDEFFYPNPLASAKGYKRSKWFGCSCCPVNDVRFVPQIPSFAYATDGKNIYLNLFMSGTAEIGGVGLSVETEYPWKGDVALDVKSASRPFSLKVRIPGWAVGRPVPSDLYVQTKPSSLSDVSLSVNGKKVKMLLGADGYVTLNALKAGDKVNLSLPMDVKRIRAHKRVKADCGRLAVERGPILYCAEGADNARPLLDASLPEDATFTEETVIIGDKTFPALRASNGLKLVPYCIWGNRQGGNEMQTWFLEK